jgi:zinc protease
MTWRGPSEFTPDEPALDALASILANGKASRLYKRLVYEEKIAQDVSASFSAEALGGSFEIVATAKPGVEPQRLIEEISQEAASISWTSPDEPELERAKNSQESAFLRGLEPALRRAIQLASYDVEAKDADYLAKDLQRRRDVTTAQVQAVASKYLTARSRVVLTISPGPKPEDAP